jgi:lysophospholipase L1-like esterase
MPCKLLPLLVLALASLVPQLRAEDFFFKDGDRVVMIGDSITEQHLYSNFVEMWVTTRFPAWKLTFRNVGIGGDRSTGGNGRFKRDVISNNPTAMTVDFGMNDGGYRPFDEPGFKTYMGGLQGMADQAKAANIRAAWVTPQPLDNGDQGPTALTAYNLTLEKYSEGVKQIAEKNGGLFVDQFHPYLAVLDKARGAGPKYDRITAGDAVHPGAPGQALMAASILKGLNFPKQVSSVEIDVADVKAAKTKNCKVTDAAGDSSSVTFQRLDESLPFFPFDAASILKWTPILEDLNDYSLTVKGLKAGDYDVSLGDKVVGKYSAEQLAKGVNLAAPALDKGPVADQVKAIRGAIEAKNRFYHDSIFRGVILSNVGNFPDWLGIKMTAAEIESKRQAALAERLEKMPALDAAIRAACEIKPHVVTIAAAK